MEQNFQTSFIPKKPIVTEERTETARPRRPVSILTLISIFIFLAVVLATGGLYLYKSMLQKNITEMSANLALAQERFEPAKINQLQVLGKRLSASDQILTKHIAISPIFETLQESTMKTIRYTDFNYSFGTEKNSKLINVIMSGQAIGYRSIALQADLLAENKNIIDPTFSNLKLDDKGNVLFDLEFSVDPNFVDYKQMLLSETEVTSGTTQENTGNQTMPVQS
ncbi:MAG TPA: hypothetical protein PLO44_00210 [Candidatus Paceibacterota bacterium]|nr:hypothetical protein [Candidatus Paceibacterota bacterium]